MQDSSNQGARMAMGGDAVDQDVEQVLARCGRLLRGPDMRLHPHRGAVAAGIEVSLIEVPEPGSFRLSQVRRSGLGGPPAAERVRGPDGQLDPGECLDVETPGVDSAGHREPELSVVAVAASRQPHVYTELAADPPGPVDRVSERPPLPPPAQAGLAGQLGDEAQGICPGGPPHRADAPPRAADLHRLAHRKTSGLCSTGMRVTPGKIENQLLTVSACSSSRT